MKPIPLAYKLRSLAGSPLRRRIRSARDAFLKTARTSCREAQHRILQELLSLNSGSAFCRDFGLHPGMSLSEFRNRVPVADYELVRPYVDRVAKGEHHALLGRHNRLLMFAMTSGTTAESRLIPVTDRFLSDYRRGWQIWGIGAYSEHDHLPELNIVQVASSHRRFTSDDGTPCGNISGLVVSMQNPIVRTLYSIPASLMDVKTPAVKRHMILRFALQDPMVGMMITANPSTLLQMMEQATADAELLIREIHNGGWTTIAADQPPVKTPVLRPNPSRAKELENILAQHGKLLPTACWPWMKLLGVWCGGSCAAYIRRLRELCNGLPVRDHGLHASEGRMTLPLEDNQPAGVLEVETHFFEFIPAEEADSTQPTVLEAHELLEGREYFILLTTSSGLYRYNIRDVVRCVGFYGSTPLLEFRHKGAHISSITGEKLAESQIVESMRHAEASTGVHTRLFTLTPMWDSPPGYVLFVKPLNASTSNDDWLRLGEQVERCLIEQNEEYREKRATARLRPLKVQVLPDEAWDQLHVSRTRRSGGSLEQYKHPCLIPDPEFQQVFLQACGIDPTEHGRQ
ncbi:MAG: GH3 auxin-responsive promoter family protein [Planctomycetaceae bacterium]|nr:GH3 auxin-responsive promoter family protein [Planctomycetaceae bacterium]